MSNAATASGDGEQSPRGSCATGSALLPRSEAGVEPQKYRFWENSECDVVLDQCLHRGSSCLAA